MKNNDIFHVHTYRCGHAGEYADEEYVQAAIALRADSITFTDHAPFPHNPFKHRMRMNALDEYIQSLKKLQVKYKNIIRIIIGLEVEYFPSYEPYYHDLVQDTDIQLLVLGQHMYDLPDGGYSFSLPNDTLDNYEYVGLGNNIVSGIKTMLFPVVVHPDRIFRRRNHFGDAEYQISKNIIDAALQYNVSLEKNKSSLDTGLYVPEFWEIAEKQGVQIVHGLDAHSPAEICLWHT